MKTHRLTSTSPDDTAALARGIAPHLKPGDTILLAGQIGGGKTNFARSLIQSQIDIIEHVPSPTYTLVQIYQTHRYEVWHCDLYRLSNPDEVFELGITDAFETSVCLIEWPDRLGDLTPSSAMTLEFRTAHQEGLRTITATYTDDRWDFMRDLANV